MNDRIGQQLGNYRLLRLLGQGGQASVYLGEHLYLGSQAALKIRHAVLTGEERAVFLQEAQTLVRLTHPHIVRVLDFALQDGMPFLVMEYAPHGTLRKLHPRGTQLPLDVILPYIQQVASALQYTHDQGLIHRDVKPENMLLSSRDEVLLSDFGLVMLAPQTLSSGGTERMEPSLAGTTPYLAPEQLRGKTRPASDQYALGVVVYEWLCGKPPFRGPLLEVAVQHVSVPPPSLREQVPDLSPAIEDVVLRALAKEPELRFARVQDFATALEQASQQASPRLTPVLAAEHGVETGHRPSSMHDLPRGTVTLLFSDMEGSTRLLQQLGESHDKSGYLSPGQGAYTSVLSECRHVLRAAFQQWSGHEIDMQGDGFFVAFARATDALSAAVEAQRALARHPWPEGAAVRVRMGLHTGEPSLTSEGYVGLDVHRAARIMSAGHGGQVLLSQTTRDLVEQDLPDHVSLRDLGEYRLKDLERPQRLFQLVIADLPADFPPLKTLDISPNNLPIQPTPLIGREQELTVVGDLLRREQVRLLTLTGPGGTGKTRLGLQVAADLSDRFPEGVFFVNLAPLTDPGLVVSTIAQALGVREQRSQPLLESLKDHLRDRQLLLLLDNFEQVIPAAVQVAELLAACPKLKFMVTSRVRLHVQAEREWAVPPLALPNPKDPPDLEALSQCEAVALFIERAQTVKADFALTGKNAAAIATICQQVDGLPLAIELAAGRSKLFSPQALLPHLKDRLKLLVGGARDLPSRQQTLRGTIAWSYDLLEEDEKRLFRRLAIFVGGCTLEAAEAICNAHGDLEEDVLDAVARLVDKSLLRQGAEIDGEPRLLMLETIREYALERLTASGEAEAMRQRHAIFFLRLSEEAYPKMRIAEHSTWLERLEAEHDNLRAALRWTLESQEAEMGLRLVSVLFRFWFARNHAHEGRIWLEQVLAQPTAQEHTAVRAKALLGAGLLAFFLGDLSEAHRLLEESLSISREVGAAGRWELASALLTLAHVVLLQGNPGVARELAGESLQVFQEIGDAWGMAMAPHVLGRATLELGDPVAARPLLEESLEQFRVVGDKQAVAHVINAMGLMALRQGDYARARTHFEQALSVARETGNKQYIADALAHLGTVSLRMGEYHESFSFYQQSLALNREQGYKYGIVEDLAAVAEVASLVGQPERAAYLFGAVEVLREMSGIRLSPLRRTEYDRTVEGLRAQLDDAAFGQAWAQGRSMPLEQVIAYAEVSIDALPTDTKPPPGSPLEASSDLLPGALLPPPSPALSPRRALKQHFGGLTAREREVARLVAQGKSNRAIADELVVGVSTVEAHISHIFTKLGFSSRAQIAAWAVENGLAQAPPDLEVTWQEH